MAVIHGTVRNGGVVFDTPASLPEGAKVEVHLIDDPDRIGIPEEEQGDDAESIAAWIAWLDQLPAIQLTEEEWERWQQARADKKARELAQWDERTARARKLFP